MNVLVIAPYALWTPHLETDLEIIQIHLDRGDNVHVLVCNASLLTCDPNPNHKLSVCLECIGKSKAGLNQLSHRVKTSSLINLEKKDKNELGQLQTQFESVKDLRTYKIGGCDIGMGALSSLVSELKDPEPNLQNPPTKERLKKLLISSFAVYRSVRNYIRDNSIDVAYLFNGRMAVLRGAFRAARDEDVLCYIHDRGCDFNHYQIYRNALPHNIENFETEMRSAWDGADSKSKEIMGAQFYQERVDGVKQSWISFTNEQNKGLLPAGWNDEAHNIVVFTSSEDEFVAVGDEWRSPLYTDQLDALKQITKDLAKENLQIYIRMHPNLRQADAMHVREMLSLSEPNLTIISPESIIDSYELLKNADQVLTFGSTIGIEATYWGKASSLAGVCFWRNLGGTYNPSTHQELLDLLRTKHLIPKPKESALIYGYYQKTRGKKFRYFEGLDVWDGLFKGKRISPLFYYRYLSRILHKFERLLDAISLRRIKKALGINTH